MNGFIVDWSVLAQIASGIVISIIAYLHNALKNETAEVKAKGDKTYEELMNYKLAASDKFVTTDHLTQTMENVHKTLESVAAGMLRVEARLNNQIDNSIARSSNN